MVIKVLVSGNSGNKEVSERSRRNVFTNWKKGFFQAFTASRRQLERRGPGAFKQQIMPE